MGGGGGDHSALNVIIILIIYPPLCFPKRPLSQGSETNLYGILLLLLLLQLMFCNIFSSSMIPTAPQLLEFRRKNPTSALSIWGRGGKKERKKKVVGVEVVVTSFGCAAAEVTVGPTGWAPGQR